MALLHNPTETNIPRIENLELQIHIHSRGCYGTTICVDPGACTCDFNYKNVVTLGEEHAFAIGSLELLRHPIKALEDDDYFSLINYRKQLKIEKPELYAAYFSMIKQRKWN